MTEVGGLAHRGQHHPRKVSLVVQSTPVRMVPASGSCLELLPWLQVDCNLGDGVLFPTKQFLVMVFIK